jgi:hypothetical protein
MLWKTLHHRNMLISSSMKDYLGMIELKNPLDMATFSNICQFRELLDIREMLCMQIVNMY